MSFLNKKENVLDIELTQHGKRLLSRGKFSPKFFAFFDDDILYDSEYGGFSEARNSAGDRIKDDTPTLQVQYVFSGIETDVKKAVELKRRNLRKGLDEGVMIQGTPEKHYATSAPLGNSSLSDSKAPAWSVNVLKGEISGSVRVVTGSQPNIKIPQLTMTNVTYKTSPVSPPLNASGASLERLSDAFGRSDGSVESDLNFVSSRFEDGSFIKIEDDFILLEVNEDNVDSLSENYDIEVFIKEVDSDTGQDVFTPLLFDVKEPLVVNDILVDQDSTLPIENRSLDPTYVDHFFHVYVDDEIGKDVLCKFVPTSVIEASFPADFLECDDVPLDNTTLVDAIGLYESDVDPTDLDDDC